MGHVHLPHLRHLDNCPENDLQQSKRYSRTFSPSAETQFHAQNWGAQSEFRIPFVFATNGRPYLRQLATKSGIWFCDLRDPKNRSAALDGWYSPDGLQALLRQDEGKAHTELDNTPFNYGFPLRYYQQAAIRATESSIAERASYGAQLLDQLGQQLSQEFGRGFEARNLRRMVRFAQAFPDAAIVSTLSTKLSWSHLVAIVPLKTPEARQCYAAQAAQDGWSVRELSRLSAHAGTPLLAVGSCRTART